MPQLVILTKVGDLHIQHSSRDLLVVLVYDACTETLFLLPKCVDSINSWVKHFAVKLAVKCSANLSPTVSVCLLVLMRWRIYLNLFCS